MKKSLLALTALAATSLMALVGCGETGTSSSSAASTTAPASTSSQAAKKHHFNVRIWNDEFQNRFRKYSTLFDHTNTDGTDTLKDGTIVNWIMVENKSNKYQNALDDAIAAQHDAAQDDKLDMFLVEADYAMKYSDQQYTDKDGKATGEYVAEDVKGDIGLTDADLAQQYDYTKKILTSSDSKLRGVSWQATPGLYAYRTDIAQEVLGVSEPGDVQPLISDWTKFNNVAARMKAHVTDTYKEGVHMLAGKDDSYRTYSNNVTSPWVTVNASGTPVCHLDDNIKKWVKDTKAYADAKYLAGSSDDYSLWGKEWGNQMSKAGSTFGFFWSTWGINFSLQGYADPKGLKKEDSSNLWGKYRVCEGPQSYYWGGTWILGASGTDDNAIIKQTMKDLTCDGTIMTKITKDTEDYTNNKAAMKAIGDDKNYGSSFLGGQNHVALFTTAASKISMNYLTAYDQGCNENFQQAMKDYFFAPAGETSALTYAEAISNFKALLKKTYPAMTFDSTFKDAL
jgi:multiple sugar transport system substrate-binding protein